MAIQSCTEITSRAFCLKEAKYINTTLNKKMDTVILSTITFKKENHRQIFQKPMTGFDEFFSTTISLF